uniref:Uncharacterized protein n=1 Tax=Ramu stunt virus TaxID=1738604 RepID=A0A513XAK2_9VIRU|nr:hypothetical protein [Ramu stunt virus]QDH12807.1 hypothetical protein [Ramu stunt virus]QDH12818.1 hypothetical protein [Ramu stunt virus]QDH12819.1 hypothetical protein [Ramu stunt virus]QDH12820.1 hypothetical protein [Ramu stunt virus]
MNSVQFGKKPITHDEFKINELVEVVYDERVLYMSKTLSKIWNFLSSSVKKVITKAEMQNLEKMMSKTIKSIFNDILSKTNSDSGFINSCINFVKEIISKKLYISSEVDIDHDLILQHADIGFLTQDMLEHPEIMNKEQFRSVLNYLWEDDISHDQNIKIHIGSFIMKMAHHLGRHI